MSEKKFYWLKLKSDFFSSKRIKKLRKLAGGDTYTIIYLKMQLLAMQTDGMLKWSGLEDDFASELALDLDETPENVEVTLQYLLSCGLAETEDCVNFFFPWAVQNTGSETSAAQRMRDSRARRTLECNNVTPLLQQAVTSYTEKDKEKDKELELEKDSKRKRFTAPTIDEVRAYCQERGNSVDPAHFIAHYEANGWKVGRNQMKDWKAAVRTWEKNEFQRSPKYASTGQQKPLDADTWDKIMERI